MCKCIQHLRSCSFGPVQAWHKTLTETDISKHMLEAFQWNEGYMEVVLMGQGCKELLAMLCSHALTIALIYRCRMSETCSSTHNINGDILSKGFDITRLRAFVHSFIRSFIHSFSQSVSQSFMVTASRVHAHVCLACARARLSRLRTLLSFMYQISCTCQWKWRIRVASESVSEEWVSESVGQSVSYSRHMSKRNGCSKRCSWKNLYISQYQCTGRHEGPAKDYSWRDNVPQVSQDWWSLQLHYSLFKIYSKHSIASIRFSYRFICRTCKCFKTAGHWKRCAAPGPGRALVVAHGAQP